MSTPDREPKPFATPKQAKDLFKEVGTLTTFKGELKPGGHSRLFELQGSGAPAEVSAHFPRPDENARSYVDSVKISQLFDSSTGRPKQVGSVAWLIFERHERTSGMPANYFTNVVYDILARPDGDEPIYELERHVTAVSDAQTAKDGLRSALAALANPDTFLAEKKARDEALAEARALGLLAVYATEAQQLISFVQELHYAEGIGL